MKREEKLQAVRGKVLILGLDIGKKKHFAQAMTSEGFRLKKPFSFNNNMDDFERLEGRIHKLMFECNAERVVIGMEPTGHYWKPLAYWLRNRGYSVVLVKPMSVKRHKEDVDNSPGKSDPKDCGVVADLVYQGKYLQAIMSEGVFADLRSLSVTRRQQRAKLTSAACNLLAVLDEFFPEFTQVFKDPHGLAATWVLLHCPFPQDILAMPIEQLIEGIATASRNRLGRAKAEQLREAAKRSIGVSVGLRGARLRLKNTVEEIQFFKNNLRAVEQAMEEALVEANVAEPLLSIHGIGVVTAARFIGEIGDPNQYESWRQIRNLAGLNLAPNQSGQHQGRTRITKRGRPELRCLLYQAAVVMVANNPDFKALYQYFKRRPVNPLTSKQALIAVALKLLRIMWTLLRRNEVYDPSKVLGRERDHQFASAA